MFAELKEKPAARWYNLIFVTRRQLFIVTIFCIANGSYQLTLLLLLTVFDMIYIAAVKPFKEEKVNKVEIFNNCCVYLCILLALALT
jgi:hypothetical protein